METYNGKERAFVQYSKIDIVKDSLPEDTYEKFSVGVFGTQQKQFFIIFYTMAGIPSVKLEACSNSWDFLYECKDILLELSRVDKSNFKPEDAYHLLLTLGIRDITSEINRIPQTT